MNILYKLAQTDDRINGVMEVVEDVAQTAETAKETALCALAFGLDNGEEEKNKP